MKKALLLALLASSIASIPAAQAQYQSMAPVAGVGPDNPLTYAGTGLGLSSFLTTRDTLSHEYGITLPFYWNNVVEMAPRQLQTRLTAGCYGTCFF